MSLLNEETKSIIKQTAPVLATHGLTITTTMYKNLFNNHPELKIIFNQTHQVPEKGKEHAAQPMALAQAVHAYAANIDDLSVLASAIERIAEKHVGSNVEPHHYDIVGIELINALKEVLGEAATPEIVQAWTNGYQFLANILIDIEKKKMEEKASVPGGWKGLKEFQIARKVQESEKVYSFYLKPKDGSCIPKSWKAGQYVGIRANTKEHGEVQRMYSISCPPGDGECIRITVKDIGKDNITALVSSHLHLLNEGESVHITMPCGDFVIENLDKSVPVTIIGLGIGLTPLLSMAKQAAKTNTVEILLGARNENCLPLLQDFEKLAEEHENVSLQVFYKNQHKKRMSFDYIWSTVRHDSAYYFCGPSSWMEEVAAGLKKEGVHPSRVVFEFFGPTLQI